MKNLLVILSITSLCLLSRTILAQSSVNTQKKHKKILTYKTFAEQKTQFGYHKTRTRTYKIQKLPLSAISFGESEQFTRTAAAAGPYYGNAQKCSGDIFAGVDRAVAKTHEVDTTAIPAVSFSGFDDFYNSGLLVSDDQMLNYNPPILKDPGSSRVNEENVNISIDTVYIYGIYRESDNDFHMIIGNGQTDTAMWLLNAEISGLPGDMDDSLLIAVRSMIIARFGDIACQDGAYKPVGTLIPIKITGSIFFDVDHRAGVVGFGVYKPQTAWEIHPVTGITFLDE